jgi:hypothetical protein
MNEMTMEQLQEHLWRVSTNLYAVLDDVHRLAGDQPYREARRISKRLDGLCRAVQITQQWRTQEPQRRTEDAGG